MLHDPCKHWPISTEQNHMVACEMVPGCDNSPGEDWGLSRHWGSAFSSLTIIWVHLPFPWQLWPDLPLFLSRSYLPKPPRMCVRARCTRLHCMLPVLCCTCASLYAPPQMCTSYATRASPKPSSNIPQLFSFSVIPEILLALLSSIPFF